MGYDLERFIGRDIDPAFICGLCRNVLDDAWIIKTCGHIICGTCIFPWAWASRKMAKRRPDGRMARATCPIDGESFKQLLTPPQAFVNELGQLQVRCKWSDKGCLKVSKLCKIREHEEKRCKTYGRLYSVRMGYSQEIWVGMISCDDGVGGDGDDIYTGTKTRCSLKRNPSVTDGLSEVKWPSQLKMQFMSNELSRLADCQNWLGKNDKVHVEFLGTTSRAFGKFRSRLKKGLGLIFFQGTVCVIRHVRRWGVSQFTGRIPRKPEDFMRHLRNAMRNATIPIAITLPPEAPEPPQNGNEKNG